MGKWAELRRQQDSRGEETDGSSVVGVPVSAQVWAWFQLVGGDING